MIKDREMDIWHLEAQLKVQKLFEEWLLHRLGDRAKRVMQPRQPQMPVTEVPNAGRL